MVPNKPSVTKNQRRAVGHSSGGAMGGFQHSPEGCGETLWGWYLPRSPQMLPRKSWVLLQVSPQAEVLPLEQVALSPGLGSQQEWADSAISPLQAFREFHGPKLPTFQPLASLSTSEGKVERVQLSCALVPSDRFKLDSELRYNCWRKEFVHQTGLSPGVFLLRSTQLQWTGFQKQASKIPYPKP